MQLKPITAIAVLMLLVASLLVSGCTTTTTSQNQTASATPQVSEVSPTIAAPSVSSKVSISSALATYRDGLIQQGYSFLTPFNKTTLNGKEVYVGNYQKNGQQYADNIYPAKSYAEAVTFKETLITAYKNQGYERYTSSTTGEDRWYGTAGNTMVMIETRDSNTTLGVPVTWVTITPIA